MPIKYNAWIEWAIIPTCNLSCKYCYSRLRRTSLKEKIEDLAIKTFIDKRHYSINIPALLAALKRSGRTFRLGLVGGEPFLVPNIVEACEAITKDHYISFSTNLTSPKVAEFSGKISPERTVYINASLHIKELERTRLVDRYVDNYLACLSRGFPIHAQEIAYPPLAKEAEYYTELYRSKGVDMTFASFYGDYNGKSYPDSYTEEEIRAFGLDLKKCYKKVISKGVLCNAGFNVGICNSYKGELRLCWMIKEPLGNIYETINFKKDMIACTSPICICPFNIFDKELHQSAIEESKKNKECGVMKPA